MKDQDGLIIFKTFKTFRTFHTISLARVKDYDVIMYVYTGVVVKNLLICRLFDLDERNCAL
mgnify:CR=1 FL=1